MGVHRNTIVGWEQGSYLPKTRPRVLELAQALHLNEQDTEHLLHASFLSTFEEQQTSATITPSQPAQLWNIPYRRNPYFTGRDKLLHLIEQHLSATEQEELTTTRLAALTQPQAIKGLGGIGKTQIAVEYAYRAREQDQYTHTLWMNAASKEALMTSFTALAELLPEFPAKNETDQQKLVAAIKRWLEQCQQRWLLIFDNADDLSTGSGVLSQTWQWKHPPHHSCECRRIACYIYRSGKDGLRRGNTPSVASSTTLCGGFR